MDEEEIAKGLAEANETWASMAATTREFRGPDLSDFEVDVVTALVAAGTATETLEPGHTPAVIADKLTWMLDSRRDVLDGAIERAIRGDISIRDIGRRIEYSNDRALVVLRQVKRYLDG